MEEFTNNPVLQHDLPNFEQADFTPLSRKYIRIILLNLAIFGIMLFGIIAAAYYFLHEHINVSWTLIIAAAALLFLLVFVSGYFGFFQRRYAIREKDIIYQEGLLKRTVTVIPFNRTQHIALAEGWYSRILGLKSIRIFTAGSVDLTVNGLPKEVAEKINQLILNKIRSEKADETVENNMTQNFADE